MKFLSLVMFVTTVYMQAEGKKNGNQGKVDVDQCHLCDWTDMKNCTKSKEVQTCDEGMVCTTRYRLIDDGDIQVKKGCKNKAWSLNQPQCEDTMNDNEEFVVGEPCISICEGHMCNTQDTPVVKGPTSRSCYQCGYSTNPNCQVTDLCPMSIAACATQVKFSLTGEKLYQYKCYQKSYCQQNLSRKNHRNCGSSPSEATRVPRSRVCNYCTSDVDADNSNPM